MSITTVATSVTPVVLCGGSGTRLLPLSRKSLPKQFVPLIGNKSLLQLTLECVSLLSKHVICFASDEHRFLVAEAMQASKVQGTVLLEPVARNTAAAMAIAALAAKPEDLLLFCPSDHHIADAAIFALVVKQGVDSAQTCAIVTFGVSPTFPGTAYGYIRQGSARADGAFNVDGFTEKPAQDKAEALLLSGSALWNAGIFLCSAQTLLSALGQHAPGILQACQLAMAPATQDGSFVRPQPQAFQDCCSESIDYAVMEHHANVVVLPFASAWSDVGSWNAVADLTPADARGNRINGQGFALHANNAFVHAPPNARWWSWAHKTCLSSTPPLPCWSRPSATWSRSSRWWYASTQTISRNQSNTEKSPALRALTTAWRWMSGIKSNASSCASRVPSSACMHHHRAEHWIVVKGTALVTRGEEKILFTENQSTYIPLSVKHPLGNSGKTDLELIEVQLGNYLDKGDIVRFEDTYGRVPVVESASNPAIANEMQ